MTSVLKLGASLLRSGGMLLAVMPGSAAPQVPVEDIDIGMIGQSNMANMPFAAIEYPLGDARSLAYNRAGAFYRIGNYNDARPANEPSTQGAFTPALSDNGGQVYGDGIVYFANLIAQAMGARVRLIERAVSGSSIARWMDDYPAQGNCWIPFRDAVITSGVQLRAVMWYQGEEDAHNLNPTTYRTMLARLHQQCLALSGRSAADFHFGIVTLGPTGGYNGSVEGEFGAMRALQADYANTTAGAFLASTAHDGQTGDPVHQIAVVFSRIWRRGAKSLLARLNVGVSGAGPRISSASRAGSVVTLTVQHAGGTALMDGAGGTGTALTGFEFKDAGGNVLTYSATSFPTASTIRMTVNGTPATVSYAMANSPHAPNSQTAPTVGGIPCDNALYYNSTVGCPLQPCAAIAITGS